jgi:LytS/YehU family sensor histidine kinase
VENAFKHGLDSKGEGFVHMDVRLKGAELFFEVVNSKKTFGGRLKKHSGIGLTNVQKRLNLIYPEKHKLQISDSKDFFRVKLMLFLED